MAQNSIDNNALPHEPKNSIKDYLLSGVYHLASAAKSKNTGAAIMSLTGLALLGGALTTAGLYGLSVAAPTIIPSFTTATLSTSLATFVSAAGGIATTFSAAYLGNGVIRRSLDNFKDTVSPKAASNLKKTGETLITAFSLAAGITAGSVVFDQKMNTEFQTANSGSSATSTLSAAPLYEETHSQELYNLAPEFKGATIPAVVILEGHEASHADNLTLEAFISEHEATHDDALPKVRTTYNF